jgi:hypothetical protein
MKRLDKGVFMKKIVTTMYQCETCLKSYRNALVAEYCEKSPQLQPCPVAPGKRVWVYECQGYGDSPLNSRLRDRYLKDRRFGANVVKGFHLSTTRVMSLIDDFSEDSAIRDTLHIDVLDHQIRAHEWIIELATPVRKPKSGILSREVPLNYIQLSMHWLADITDKIGDSNWLKTEYVE